MDGERKEDVENLGENRSKTGWLNDGFPFFDCWERTLLQMASSFAKNGNEITSLTGWREDGSGYSICLGSLGGLWILRPKKKEKKNSWTKCGTWKSIMENL